MKVYLSPHFDVREFVPPEIYNRYGETGSLWFIDPRLVSVAEKIRVFIGKPMFINTWHMQGRFKERGYRLPHTPTGADKSQHKFGRAIDFSINGIKPEEIRDIIRKHWIDFGVTTIEQGTNGWTHVDIRNTGRDKLLEVPYQQKNY